MVAQTNSESELPFDLKIANVVKDSALMKEARGVAADVLSKAPQENLSQYSMVWNKLWEVFCRASFPPCSCSSHVICGDIVGIG